jgi:glycosyltransferase involved in cell wall biosynthesis
MRLDIMLPYWGDPGLLHATVESVRAQTDPSWSLTIVDDCYPDPSVAERYAHEPDPRITYRRNETNVGITANYELCRDLATEELMMFLGCDDLLGPTFVETVLAAHRRFPEAAIIQPGVRVVDGEGVEVHPLADRVKARIRPAAAGPVVLAGEDLAASLLTGNWLYWPSLVFRTDAVRRHEFREGLPIVQDLALVIDMVAAGESLVLDPTPCFSYRRHGGSASALTLATGTRLADDRRYYADAVAQMEARGWSRAARAGRRRLTSRMHALSLVPGAARRRDLASLRGLARHALAG